MSNNSVFAGGDIGNALEISKCKVISFYTHTHMHNEMLVYQPFDGHIMVNNMKFEISSQTVALIRVSDFHSTTIFSNCQAECLKIAFPDEILNSLFIKSRNASVVMREYKKSPLLTELLEKFKNTSDRKEQIILLNTILLELYDVGEKVNFDSMYKMNAIVMSAIRIINQSFFENISLASVANELGVTPQYLSNIFTKETGISFSKYLCTMRLRYAEGLLMDNDMNITEVCYSCGYRNLSHFIRSFKRKYGKSPSEYIANNHPKAL